MGWADVSYFSKIQWGCPVGSLPRPLLWNALTHSWRANRRDRQTARKYVWHRNCVYTWHTYTGSVIHCAWLCFFHTVSFQGTFFMPFCPLFSLLPHTVFTGVWWQPTFFKYTGSAFHYGSVSPGVETIHESHKWGKPGDPCGSSPWGAGRQRGPSSSLVASTCVKGDGNDFQVTGGERTKGSMNQFKRVG